MPEVLPTFNPITQSSLFSIYLIGLAHTLIRIGGWHPWMLVLKVFNTIDTSYSYFFSEEVRPNNTHTIRKGIYLLFFLHFTMWHWASTTVLSTVEYPCCMSMLHTHAAYSCCIVTHIHAACLCMSMLRVHTCQCCMFVLHFHAAHSCFMSMLHVHAMFMLHVHAAWPCCTCMSVLYVRATCSCCIFLMFILHVYCACLCYTSLSFSCPCPWKAYQNAL